MLHLERVPGRQYRAQRPAFGALHENQRNQSERDKKVENEKDVFHGGILNIGRAYSRDVGPRQLRRKPRNLRPGKFDVI